MASTPDHGASTAAGKTGLLSTVSRAASKGRSATMSALHLTRSPNRFDPPSSPKPPGTGKTETPNRQPLTTLSGISSTATSAIRGLASGVGIGGGGGGGGGGSAGGGAGSGNVQGSDTYTEGPGIRKGYLLMLRKGGQIRGGDVPGRVAGGEVSGGGAGGAGVEEWSERFFYLCGHFLRYKKQSRNLTSVNLKQTDHVEFDLQAAIVETPEEAQQRGGLGAATAFHTQRKYAFRLVVKGEESAAAMTPSKLSPTSSMASPSAVVVGSSRSTTAGFQASGEVSTGVGAKDAALMVAEDVKAREARASGPIEDHGGPKAMRKVWVLAATNAEERAMWMQAIREAISLGQELLCHGDAGCEARSLANLAVRMSKELEVRDRHYRLRFYRSCFIGEDAVSWLQSECGPCSVDEALSLGNKMIAAGLIYHCTYAHGLENSRLFYKFAASVVSLAGENRNVTKGSRLARGAWTTGPGGEIFADSGRPYGSASDLTGIFSGGDDFRHRRRSFAAGGKRGLDMDKDEGTEDSDESASIASIMSMDDGGGGGGDTALDGGTGAGGGSAPLLRGVSGRRKSVFRAVSGEADGEKSVSLKRMAREMEELKLSSTEMERSQMRAEQQMRAFAAGLSGCLESSVDRCMAAIAATVLVASLSLALHAANLGQPSGGIRVAGAVATGVPWSHRFVQVLMIGLVVFALRSYYDCREGIKRAMKSTKELCFGDAPAEIVERPGHGLGGGERATDAGVADESESVPLLHAAQVKELVQSGIVAGIGSRACGKDKACKRSRRPRPIDILARMASNRDPLIPRLVHSSLDPLSSAASSPHLPNPPPPPPLTMGVGSRVATDAAGAGASAAEAAAAAKAAAPVVPPSAPSGREGGEAEKRDEEESGGAASSRGVKVGSDVVAGGGAADDAPGDRGGVMSERPELASLPAQQEWPHYPIFVRLSPSVAGQVRLDGHEPNSSIPVNSDDVAVPFETPLFKGRLLVRIAGLPGEGAQEYFRGKKRLMQCAVQGQFKKELPFTRAYTGQAYLRPFTHLPAKWLIRSAFSLIRRLSPALREDITGDRPYMVSPLAATAQAIRAEAPGDEAAIVGDLGEETGLLGASFMDSRVPASARKKFFSNLRNLQAYSFKPGVVYTFDFYQHLYNAVTFELDLGFRSVKLADYLNHQPAQIMALDFETGEMLWNVEIWNAALLKVANGS